jgi:hypothetical protein
VCHYKCKTGKYFAIHHKNYINGEKTHNDFKDSKCKTDRLSYYRYLEPIVRANPKRFALLCNEHHQAVTRLRQWAQPSLKRLVRLTYATEYISRKKTANSEKIELERRLENLEVAIAEGDLVPNNN